MFDIFYKHRSLSVSQVLLEMAFSKPWPWRQFEVKLLWPWPRRVLALASVRPGHVLGLDTAVLEPMLFDKAPIVWKSDDITLQIDCQCVLCCCRLSHDIANCLQTCYYIVFERNFFLSCRKLFDISCLIVMLALYVISWLLLVALLVWVTWLEPCGPITRADQSRASRMYWYWF